MGIKELARSLKTIIANAGPYYRENLQKVSRIAEAENELATVTSGGFVRTISPVLKELSYMTPEPGTEVYIRHLEHATEMICEGNEQAEVIAYYDNKLKVAKRR